MTVARINSSALSPDSNVHTHPQVGVNCENSIEAKWQFTPAADPHPGRQWLFLGDYNATLYHGLIKGF